MKRVAVVGLGYVGITLAAALASRGFTVIGYDREARVREALAAGRTHLYEPGIEEALAETLGRTFHVRGDLKGAEVDAAVICVSTPVDDVTRQPRLESLRSAARQIADELGPETLVVVRSTVPVGATRSVVLPELTARWGAARLAFCPERTIQGQALRELQELPQVIGGLDDASRAAAAELFEQLTRRVVTVSSLEAAELVKLVNNAHTDLIYSYGNEVALLSERLRLDPLEVIRAANVDYPRPDLSRPGFVGGGCLSKDPYILIESGKAAGYEPWLVGRARGLNEHLPGHVGRRFVDLLRETRGAVAGARVVIFGFAYKGWPPTDDMRGTPVTPIIETLRAEGIVVRGHDYIVRADVIAALGAAACDVKDGFDGADGVLLVTNHPEYARLDLPSLLHTLRRPALVYDCWRVLDEATVRGAGVRYAGIGYG
jgi:UDP-N-acetyl-D-mannosaminuronic acid dehydrogenase